MFEDFDELEENINAEDSEGNGELDNERIRDVSEPQPIVVKRQIQIDSFFQSNKRVKDPLQLGEIQIKKQTYNRSQVHAISTEIVSKLKHAKSRPRVIITNEKTIVKPIDNESQKSDNNSSIPSTSSSLPSMNKSSELGNSRAQQDKNSSKNIDEFTIVRKMGDDSTQISKSHSQSTSKTTSKTNKIPLLETQRARIAKISQYDTIHGSRHAENLQSSIKGVYCSVCDDYLKDMSQLFLQYPDGSILPTCHIVSQKHNKNLDTWLKTKRRSQSLVKLLSDVTPTIDRKVVDFRYDLLELLLRLRIPLSVVNDQFFRDFISKHVGPWGRFLTDRSNLAKEYIGKINTHEELSTKEFFKDQFFSIQVDSTKRVGEWYGFVLRTVSDELDVIHRPILRRMSRHLLERNFYELSALLNTIVHDVIHFGGGNVDHFSKKFVALAGDRVSLNRCAFNSANMFRTYPYTIFIDCHSHTLANCGKVLENSCLVQDEFWQLHNSVFARGETAKHQWREFYNKSMIDYSETRWFGKREAKDLVRKIFDTHYKDFFNQEIFDSKQKTTSIYKMRQLICPNYWEALTDEELQAKQLNLFYIRLELAIICNCTYKYSLACYRLEGDGPIGAFVFTEINELFVILDTHTLEDYPDVNALVDEAVMSLPLDATHLEKQAERVKWRDFTFEKINAAKEYFISHFLITNPNALPTSKENNFGHLIRMYEVFALVDPRYMRTKEFIIRNSNEGTTLRQFVRNELTVLLNMDRISAEHLEDLVRTVDVYAISVRQFEYVSQTIDRNEATFEEKLKIFLEFWKEYKTQFPHWFSLVKIVMLHQPNSCAVERLFSVLKRVLKSENENCLDDYIQAAVTLAYNDVNNQ